jgi:hypothetical protein
VRQKKVDAAMQILQNTTGVHVKQADTGWIFEIGRCEQNCAPGSKAPPPTKSKQHAHWLTCPNHGGVIYVSNDPQNKLYQI